MKRIVTVLLSLTMVLCVSLISVGANDTPLRGDADKDGIITIMDATRIQRFIAGGFDVDIDEAAADADLDGSVGILDATRIQRFIAAMCDMNGDPISHEDPAPAQLDAPVITKVETNNKGAVIKWNAVEGAVKYRVFYKTAATGSWKKLADTSALSYTHADAAYDTEYAYTVRCISADGKTYLSDYDSDGYKNTRLQSPKLKSVNMIEGYVALSWENVSGAGAYRIYCKGGEFSSWTFLGDTDINYVDMANEIFTGNTKYSFTVRCIDALDGERFTSGYNSSGISLKYYETPEIVYLTNSNKGMSIYWSECAGVAKYRLFIYEDGKWKKLADTADTGMTVSGLNGFTVYRFTVRGMDKNSNFITPYDGYGKKFTFYTSSNLPHKYSFDNNEIKRTLAAYISRQGIEQRSTVNENKLRDCLVLGYTSDYGENSDYINNNIIDRGKYIVDRYIKMLKRNNVEPSDLYFYMNSKSENGTLETVYYIELYSK